MKYVRLRKIRSTVSPVAAPGNPATYAYGERCDRGCSLPVGYELAGWLVGDPVIGETVEILRCVRNGISCPGHFWSTEVTAVSHDGFHTQNSIYQMLEIPFETVTDKIKAEQHPYLLLRRTYL